MKIDNSLGPVRASQSSCDGNGDAATVRATVEEHESSAPSNPKDTGSSQIKMSGKLAEDPAEMNGGDAFNAKRVAQFKVAIADGSFKVNAKVVASKLVASNLEALSRSKS